MRHLLLLFSLLILGASWVAAQDTSSQTSPNADPTASQSTSAAGGETTVQGCLSGSDGSYTITDKNGNSFLLTGDTAKLAQHVGHTVRVTGTSSTASAAPTGGGNATGTTGETRPTIEVSSVKHISKTCQNGGAMR